jgi:hypothetical protein
MSLASSHYGQYYTYSSREPSDLSGLELDGPLTPLEPAYFWVPFAASHKVQPPIREPSDLSGLDLDGPPWLAVKSSSSVFLGQLTNIINCAFIVYSAFWLISVFFSLFGQIFQSKSLFQLTFSSTALFDYYPIIIWSLFSILILEMYSRYIDPLKK